MSDNSIYPPGDDRVYARPVKKVADFAFDESVARVFPDMIERSVPGYSGLIPLIGMLAEHYVQPDSRCYDLGCSLGAVSLVMARFLKDSSKSVQNCEIVAVDNAPAMIERCRAHLQSVEERVPVRLLCEDVETLAMDKASVAVMNFTLQFIEPGRRSALLEKIHRALLPGGVLILSEKIGFDAPAQQQWMSELHHAYKKANGYSDLEIAQKRSALENVLIPESTDTHLHRLQKTGFRRTALWYQCMNFASILAVK